MNVEIKDILMIIAMLFAPLGALQTRVWIEFFTEKKKRKHAIFKSLMTTRGDVTSHNHVLALNLIDIEFTKRKERFVVTAWKRYLDHLNNYPKDGQDDTPWKAKGKELLVDLLVNMGTSLGYTFDDVYIRRSIYTPQVATDMGVAQYAILTKLALLLAANPDALPVKIITSQLSSQDVTV